MTKPRAASLDIVLLPDAGLEQLAGTLESVVAALPRAAVHIARSGFPSHEALVAMLLDAGFSVLDVPAADGFDAVLAALDHRFRDRPYAYLVAGERLDAEAAATLAAGGQLVTEDVFPWLDARSPLAGPRVRCDGRPAQVRRCDVLPPRQLPTSWFPCFGRDLRAAFDSYDALLADIALLCHAGELDAAFQRAELGWHGATGDARLRLVRATTVLAQMLETHEVAVPAAAEWFRLEPIPFVAAQYLRLAVGAIPFGLADRLAAILPEYGSLSYRDGMLVETAERMVAVRSALERKRFILGARREMLMRNITAGIAKPVEVGAAFECAGLLGLPVGALVAALPEQDPDAELTIGACINVNLPSDHVAEVVVALRERWPDAPWVARLIERYVSRRTGDAARSLDAAGLPGDDHWRLLAGLPWASADDRREAQARIAPTPADAAGAADALEVPA